YKRSGGDRLRRMDANYMMFWGSLMIIIGALVLTNYYNPGNLLLLFVTFIIWLAGAIIIFSVRPKGP
ncbi:MAG TPA: hypothetical protein VLH13_05790, partial [Methanomassiliicoccales archaeon]|nr:hypothetical protein [Methanomassiliicoccales archaeon]